MNGVQAVHDVAYVHRDIKAQNILIGKNNQLLVSDLGLAAPLSGCTCKNERHDINNKSCTPTGKLHGLAGTVGQCAPEINRNLKNRFVPEGYNGQAIDMFNLGVVLFNLLFGAPAFFNASHDDDFYQHIQRNDSEMFWQMQAMRTDLTNNGVDPMTC